MKFNNTTLRLLALSILENSSNGVYGKGLIDTRSGKTQRDLIETRCIQSFCDLFRIVIRSQTGKLKMSQEKTAELEKDVARDLCRLKRGFESGELDQECIKNADETHFVFNMDDGRTLGFTKDQEVRYTDITSGTEVMTMRVRISVGVNGPIEPPIMIFKNKSCNYPMRNVPDNGSGVTYRKGPKGWMDSLNMIALLLEPRVIKPFQSDKISDLFIDNRSSHNLTEDILGAGEAIRTNQHYFPNTTELFKPCDAIVILKIKATGENVGTTTSVTDQDQCVDGRRKTIEPW